ncbi:hypothetical protein CR513_43463, partial [Mucuna pruriens]
MIQDTREKMMKEDPIIHGQIKFFTPLFSHYTRRPSSSSARNWGVKMKRGFVNSRKSYGSVEDAKLTTKYYSLLEEYSEIQKEFVSKKRKLQVEKQKRDILLDQVRFLRHRHAYLTKLQNLKVEPELGPSQNADVHHVPIEKEINCVANVTSIQQESNEREELVEKTQTITHKPQNFSINGKKSGKKKVTWNDEVVKSVG